MSRESIVKPIQKLLLSLKQTPSLERNQQFHTDFFRLIRLLMVNPTNYFLKFFTVNSTKFCKNLIIHFAYPVLVKQISLTLQLNISGQEILISIETLLVGMPIDEFIFNNRDKISDEDIDLIGDHLTIKLSEMKLSPGYSLQKHPIYRK